MKKLFITLLLLIIAIPCYAAIVQEQNVDKNTRPAATTSEATVLTSVTTGQLIVSFLAVDKDSGGITIPANFTLVNDTQEASISGAIAYKISTGGETSITWTWVNSRLAVVRTLVFSGLATSGVLDKAAENSGTGNSLSTGTTATTTQASEMAVAMVAIDSFSNADSPPPSWDNSFNLQGNIDESDIAGDTNIPQLSVATLELSSTQAVETTASWEASDQAWATVATFKAASTDSGSTVEVGGNPAIDRSAIAFSGFTHIDLENPITQRIVLTKVEVYWTFSAAGANVAKLIIFRDTGTNYNPIASFSFPGTHDAGLASYDISIVAQVGDLVGIYCIDGSNRIDQDASGGSSGFVHKFDDWSSVSSLKSGWTSASGQILSIQVFRPPTKIQGTTIIRGATIQ